MGTRLTSLEGNIHPAKKGTLISLFALSKPSGENDGLVGHPSPSRRFNSSDRAEIWGNKQIP